jgi:hypothetical protein
MSAMKEIPVVCHDFRSVVTGTLREITETGCELVSAQQTSGPVFPQKTKVLLNLLDEKSGRSVNVSARLTAAQRFDGKWVYRIRWPQVPEFLQQAA